jgi:hypothetical protein
MKIIGTFLGLFGLVVAQSDQQLSFVFELVRHGARAPIQDVDLQDFPVAEGMLTASGMRQRFLLG